MLRTFSKCPVSILVPSLCQPAPKVLVSHELCEIRIFLLDLVDVGNFGISEFVQFTLLLLDWLCIGFLDVLNHRFSCSELGVSKWVQELARLTLPYLEQSLTSTQRS